MLLAGLVVAGEPLLHRLARHLGGDPPALAHVRRRGLEHGERPARVAVGLDRDRARARRRPPRAAARQAALLVRQRPPEQRLDVLGA